MGERHLIALCAEAAKQEAPPPPASKDANGSGKEAAAAAIQFGSFEGEVRAYHIILSRARR